MLITNSWYKHFKNILEIDTWIEFEQELSNVLSQTALLFELSDSKNDKRSINVTNKGLYENFNVFQFADNDGVYVNIFPSFLDSRKQKIEEKKVLKLLSHSFLEFSMIFHKYLSKIVVKFYETGNNGRLFPIENINRIYSFNYTPSIELIYGKTEVTYLHGKINFNDDNNNIILGVNEIPDRVEKNKAYDFLKSYQKIINDSNYGIIGDEAQVEVVYFLFGHSLDFSDREYILSLLNHIQETPNYTRKIIFFYQNIQDKKNKLANLFSYVDEDTIIDLEMSKRIEFVHITPENLSSYIKKFY